jgi:hypothetical protein
MYYRAAEVGQCAKWSQCGAAEPEHEERVRLTDIGDEFQGGPQPEKLASDYLIVLKKAKVCLLISRHHLDLWI